MASQHPKWQNADEETILTWRQGQGLTEEEGYIVVDYLKVWAPTMTKAGAEGFGPSIEYMKNALASVGAEPSQENVDILWRQFLKVRGKALGDYEQRRHWIPLLCAHHGIRLDEAAQLRRRHIVRISGILCFDLRSDPGLVLKNDNARRLIPVHQKILDLGFDHLFEHLAADALLFSELSNDNKNKSFGQSVNKRYGRYLQKIFGTETAKTLTSHCFHHFVATQLGNNSEFKDSWVNELMGHEGARVSEADRYNKQIYAKHLKAMVDSIDAPIDYERLRILAKTGPSLADDKPSGKITKHSSHVD